jgi:glycosyltransferase involved in cell wall biosynthesis
MSRNILIVANELRFINTFLTPSIITALNLGFKVLMTSNIPPHQVNELSKWNYNNGKYFNSKTVFIRNNFPRSPFKIVNLFISFIKLRETVIHNEIDIIHVHTPTVAVIVRFLKFFKAMKNIRVIYSAHGFHFYRSGPLTGWLIYFPLEFFLSKFTDLLITTNEEDYKRASKYFLCSVVKLNGLGKDPYNLSNSHSRMESTSTTVMKTINLISIGELNKNKNHRFVIDSLARIKSINWTYTILGEGRLEQDLLILIKKKNLEDRIFLKGYIDDVFEELKKADIFVMPSKREGLPVSLIEAMSTDLMIVASKIRGVIDLIDDEKGGFLFDLNSKLDLVKKILIAAEKLDLKSDFQNYNSIKIKDFSVQKVQNDLEALYLKFNEIY